MRRMKMTIFAEGEIVLSSLSQKSFMSTFIFSQLTAVHHESEENPPNSGVFSLDK